MGSMIAPSRAYDLKLVYFPHKKEGMQFANYTETIQKIKEWMQEDLKQILQTNEGIKLIMNDDSAMDINESDWIVKENGRYFVIKSDFFEKYYEQK